jgi:ribosomal protein S18 acetylase RimI-like enzyme
MKIRIAQKNDIPDLVSIDRKAYGKYGADEKYFTQKLSSLNTRILVVENKGKITGFAVLEILKKDEIPNDFTDLKLDKPLEDNWIHIIAFTTETNYLDIDSDSKLVKAIEDMAKNMGVATFCVPLSVDHPFSNHDVFGFWEKNGYKNAGTIKWVASPTEKIDCYFLKKSSC